MTEQGTIGCLCPLCDGDMKVAWIKGGCPVPVNHELVTADDRVTECPACDGTGIEPSGFWMNEAND